MEGQIEVKEPVSQPELVSEEVKPQEQIQEPKKFKFKLNDKDEEFVEQELVELIQSGRNASLSLKQADEVKKQAQQILQLLKENPRKVLSDPSLGVDLYKLAEETLLEKIEQDMLTPEQKKIQEYEKRFKNLEEKEKAEQAKKDQEALAQAESHWVQEYNKLFQEALSVSQLPQTPRTIKRMAELASAHLEQGQPIDAKTLASTLREEYLVEVKELLSASETESLLEILGDEIGNKIIKADLKRLKGIPHSVMSSSAQCSSPPPKMTLSQWRDRMERIKRGQE